MLLLEVCVFRCDKSGAILIPHIDNIRMDRKTVNHLVEVEMPKHCEVQAGASRLSSLLRESLLETAVRFQTYQRQVCRTLSSEEFQGQLGKLSSSRS